MATKKVTKSVEKVKPGIQINRSRGGGKKKPDLFARLRDTSHPLDNLIPIELDFQTAENPDAQPLIEPDAQDLNILDAQPTNILDAQNTQPRTSRVSITGHPEILEPDAQQQKTATSSGASTGRPALKSPDVLTPKIEDRTSSETGKLDGKTSGKKALDVQPIKKNDYWRNWEKSRSTDRVSLRPASDILRKFKVFCVEKDLGLTEFFEIAGLKFIELDAQSDQQLDVLTPLDDRRLKMMFKSKPFIINLYLRYNSVFNEISAAGGKKWSARWSPRDDEAAVRYNDVAPSIVELGILQTQLQKGFGSSRIQTFKYYTDEIEKVLSSGVSDEMLETILDYHRKIWKNQTGREVDLKFLETEK